MLTNPRNAHVMPSCKFGEDRMMRGRLGVFSIFKMAAVCHLGFGMTS